MTVLLIQKVCSGTFSLLHLHSFTAQRLYWVPAVFQALDHTM